MNKKLRVFLTCVVVGVLTGAVRALWAQGDWSDSVLARTTAWWFGLPFLMIALVSFLIGFLGKNNAWRWVSIGFLSASTICLIHLMSAPAGRWYGTVRAKAFCESLIPLLEAVKQVSGKYPDDIAIVLPGETKLPRLVEKDFYRASQDRYGFRLRFRDPSCDPRLALLGHDAYFVYWSKLGEWKYEQGWTFNPDLFDLPARQP